MTTRLAPGDLVAALAVLNTYRRRGLSVAALPPQDRHALIVTLDAIRAHMNFDPHVGPMLEGAMDRITSVIGDGDLIALQAHDLKTVTRFLLAVPTTQRGTAA